MRISAMGGGGGGGGGDTPHPLLDGVIDSDTLAGTPVLGDLIVANATPLWARFAGQITTTKKFLTQTGTGTISAVPVWGTIVAADLPDDLTAVSITARGVAGLSLHEQGGLGITIIDATGVVTFDSDIALIGTGPGVISIFANDTDANARAYLSATEIAFGAGGASATDARITRISAAVLGLKGGNEFRWYGGTSGYVGFSAPATVTSYSCTWPNAQGASNTVLTNNGSGVLSWTSPGAASVPWAVYNLTDGTTIAVPASSLPVGTVARVTVTADGHTFSNPTSPTDGQVMRLEILSTATRTILWDSAYSGSIVPLPSQTSGSSIVDTLVFSYRASTTTWYLLAITQQAWVGFSGSSFGVLAAAYDANFSAKLGNGRLDFGAGGASALDTGISRLSAGVFGMDPGDGLAWQGSSSGSVTLTAAGTTTTYALVWPSAQGAASSVLTNDGSGNLSWVAGGGGGANTALSNLAAVAVNTALLPGTDDSIALDSASKRYTVGYFSQSVQVLAAAGDANATAQLSGSTLSLGVGGGTAVDVTLSRAAAGIAQLGTGNTLRLRGSTSGNFDQSVPATTTSYAVVWPSGQGSAGTVLTNDGSGNLSWGAAGGSGANVALSNLSGVAINATLLPGTDASISLGSTAKRWASGRFSSTVQIYDTVSDANPTASLASASLAFGAGGGTSTDVTLSRAAAGILQLQTGGSFRLRGSSSGNFTQAVPASVTSYTVTWPSAQGAASTYLKNDGSGGLTWGAAASAALDNLASVAVNAALTPGTDASIALNSAAKRYTTAYFATDIQILTSASDANPTTKVAGGAISFGPGGATGVDVTISRAAAGILALQGGGTFRLQGSTSGNFNQTVPATVTSYTVTWPSAQGAADTYLKNDGSGGLSWATVTGGSGANTALSNLASVAVNLALTPGTDNSIALNSTAKRFTSGYFATDVQILNAASDANPKAKLHGTGISMGAGGGSAVDVGLVRDATGVLKMTDGSTGQGVLKKISGSVSTLTDGATIAVDLSLGNTFTVTLGGNRTLANPTNYKDGDVFCVEFKQDGTGTRTVTLDTDYVFSNDIPSMVLSTAAGTYDHYYFKVVGTKFRVVGRSLGFAA